MKKRHTDLLDCLVSPNISQKQTRWTNRAGRRRTRRIRTKLSFPRWSNDLEIIEARTGTLRILATSVKIGRVFSHMTLSWNELKRTWRTYQFQAGSERYQGTIHSSRSRCHYKRASWIMCRWCSLNSLRSQWRIAKAHQVIGRCCALTNLVQQFHRTCPTTTTSQAQSWTYSLHPQLLSNHSLFRNHPRGKTRMNRRTESLLATSHRRTPQTYRDKPLSKFRLQSSR